MYVVLFHSGLLILFCIYLLFAPGFFFLLGDQHPLTYTHPPTLRGFCADAHRFTLKCWWVVGGVGWTTCRYSPCESDFILVTQVRAVTGCLLILFITQSGSCTLRPPRLLLCCFSLHRRQISSDLTSSPFSSTATKTQTSEGLACRLNTSACNSANIMCRCIESQEEGTKSIRKLGERIEGRFNTFTACPMVTVVRVRG